jgi:hypothetical protein
MTKRTWLVCLLVPVVFVVAVAGAYLGTSLVAKRDVPERKEGATIGYLKARLASLYDRTARLHNGASEFAGKLTPEQEERVRRIRDEQVARAIDGLRKRDGLGEREALEKALEMAERGYLRAVADRQIQDNQQQKDFWSSSYESWKRKMGHASAADTPELRREYEQYLRSRPPGR